MSAAWIGLNAEASLAVLLEQQELPDAEPSNSPASPDPGGSHQTNPDASPLRSLSRDIGGSRQRPTTCSSGNRLDSRPVQAPCRVGRSRTRVPSCSSL